MLFIIYVFSGYVMVFSLEQESDFYNMEIIYISTMKLSSVIEIMTIQLDMVYFFSWNTDTHLSDLPQTPQETILKELCSKGSLYLWFLSKMGECL